MNMLNKINYKIKIKYNLIKNYLNYLIYLKNQLLNLVL